MNLTNQPPYRKGVKRHSRGKSRHPTKAERERWQRVRSLGCILALSGCSGHTTIHHCGTGGGGRKDHVMVIPLCWEHHLGAEGIDGKRMSKRAWQERYGTESTHLERVEKLLRCTE